MIKLNLKANNKQEEIILAYLQENASETLAEKINNGTPFVKDGKPLTNLKTLSGFMKYACVEARKLAEKGANCACIEDKVVFGWAIHYFEEDSIEGTLYTIDGEEYKPAPKKTASKPIPKPEPKKEPPKSNFQFSLFDQFEETDVPKPIVEETEEPIVEPVVEPIVEKQKGNPMYLKYLEYQAEHPSAIVAYRLGDFYEVFGENAVMVGTELELTLTSRDVGLENRIPMIGFPYHAAEMYFAKIVKKHDLYIIKSNEEKQFMEKLETVLSKLQDEEDFDELTEEEMREFDGDIEEPIEEPVQTNDSSLISKLKALLGNTLEVR